MWTNEKEEEAFTMGFMAAKYLSIMDFKMSSADTSNNIDLYMRRIKGTALIGINTKTQRGLEVLYPIAVINNEFDIYAFKSIIEFNGNDLEYLGVEKANTSEFSWNLDLIIDEGDVDKGSITVASISNDGDKRPAILLYYLKFRYKATGSSTTLRQTILNYEPSPLLKLVDGKPYYVTPIEIVNGTIYVEEEVSKKELSDINISSEKPAYSGGGSETVDLDVTFSACGLVPDGCKGYIGVYGANGQLLGRSESFSVKSGNNNVNCSVDLDNNTDSNIVYKIVIESTDNNSFYILIPAYGFKAIARKRINKDSKKIPPPVKLVQSISIIDSTKISYIEAKPKPKLIEEISLIDKVNIKYNPKLISELRNKEEISLKDISKIGYISKYISNITEKELLSTLDKYNITYRGFVDIIKKIESINISEEFKIKFIGNLSNISRVDNISLNDIVNILGLYKSGTKISVEEEIKIEELYKLILGNGKENSNEVNGLGMTDIVSIQYRDKE